MEKKKIAVLVSIVLLITLFVGGWCLCSRSSASDHDSNNSDTLTRAGEDIGESAGRVCEKRNDYLKELIIQAYKMQEKNTDSMFQHKGRCVYAYISYVLSPGSIDDDYDISSNREPTSLRLTFEHDGLVEYYEYPPNKTNNNTAEPDAAMVALKNWQSDSLGKKHYRTYGNARKIIENFDLIGKPLDSIVKYLGNNFDGSITYIIDRCSDNGEIVDEAECEIWDLRIVNGTLKDGNEIVIIE